MESVGFATAQETSFGFQDKHGPDLRKSRKHRDWLKTALSGILVSGSLAHLPLHPLPG